jgi:hypothetical protein
MQAGGRTLKHWPVSLDTVCVGGGERPCILTSKCVTVGVFLGRETEAVEQQAWSKEIHIAENTGCIQHTILHLEQILAYIYSRRLTNADTKNVMSSISGLSVCMHFLRGSERAVIIEFLAKMFCS